MTIEEFIEDAKGKPTYLVERSLNKLCRDNYRYKNLSSDNRKVIMDIIKKYKSNFRQGYGIPAYSIRQEMLRLERKQEELDLSDPDLKDIRRFLEEFKK